MRPNDATMQLILRFEVGGGKPCLQSLSPTTNLAGRSFRRYYRRWI